MRRVLTLQMNQRRSWLLIGKPSLDRTGPHPNYPSQDGQVALTLGVPYLSVSEFGKGRLEMGIGSLYNSSCAV